jgi:hypothetical protein
MATTANTSEAFRYTPVDLTVNDGSVCAAGEECMVLAQTNSLGNACGVPGPCPLVVRRSVGLGYVTTVLVPWFIDGSGISLSLLAQTIIDNVVKPLHPAVVSGIHPV